MMMDKNYDGDGSKYSALRAAAAARQRQRSSSGISSAALPPQQQPRIGMDKLAAKPSAGDTDNSYAVAGVSAAAVSKSNNEPYHKLQQLKQSIIQKQEQQQQQQQQSDHSDNGGATGSAVDGDTSNRAFIERSQNNNDAVHSSTTTFSSSLSAAPAATAFPPRHPPPHTNGRARATSELGAGAGTVASGNSAGVTNYNSSSSVLATPSRQRIQQQLGSSAYSKNITASGGSDSINDDVVTSTKSPMDNKSEERIEQKLISNSHNDNDYNIRNKSPPPPKTPLSMMRSVMSSIHKDRSEIEGARQQQQEPGNVRGLFGTESVPGLERSKDDGLGSDLERAGATHYFNGNHRYHRDKSHDAAALAGPGWNDDDIHDRVSTTSNNVNLYMQRRSYPTSSCCIPYGSEIVLRFRSPQVLASLSVQLRGGSLNYSPSTLGGLAGGGSLRHYDKVCFMANEAHTLLGGVGHAGMNKFIIAKATSTNIGQVVSSEQREERNANINDEGPNNDGIDFHSTVVCYGDKITLRSDLMKRMLGVQKEKVEGYDRVGDDNTATLHAYKLDVGCFRREGRFPQANTWTVLRGGANANIVQLGSSTMNYLPTATTLEELELMKRRIPVYSGDPIVLRNDWTGGLLSLGNECQLPDMIGRMNEDLVAPGWSLNILTSTYQMNRDGAASTQDDEPLIEFLHRHNQCRPRKTETFQFFLADAPYCPSWVYANGEEENDRIYLGGSYLNFPNRHERLEEGLEMELFPEMKEGDEQRKIPQAMQSLADLPVDVQEKVLLDEILGAMMGHDGQFIQYRSTEDEDGVSEADGGDYDDDDGHPITHEWRFDFAPQSVLGGKIDSSLENIVNLILPLCTNYARVNQYVQTCLHRHECGVAARCLCEAMNELLGEYLAIVSKLDYLSREGEPFVDLDGSDSCKQLTISGVHMHARPSMRTLSILAQVVSVVRGKKGGELLNALHGIMSLNYSGDEKGCELLHYLLSRCAAPYACMLQTWLARGKVNDPYGEFMIEVTSKSFRENSVTPSIVQLQGMEWTNWCREKTEHVLFSLHGSNDEIVTSMMTGNSAGLEVDRSHATLNMSPLLKAHATGKFMRAIHCCNGGEGESCGGDDPSTLLQKVETAVVDGPVEVLLNPLKLSRSINLSYHEASDTLLRILLHDNDLLSSLGFMKKYFLLDQGDFFVDFLDGAEVELEKELPNILQGRVQNWLATSIARTSESSQLASNLRCGFQKKSLRDTLDDISRGHDSHRKFSRKNVRQKTLSGFEAIAFEFKSVPFPTSIVLSDAQFRIYQLVFRLIFFAKYVERQLVSMWSEHQLLKSMTSLRSACSPTFSLRRRMLHFIQNLVYYLKFDVIEPNWKELEEKLNATKKYCRSNQTKSNDEFMTRSDIQLFPYTVDDLLHEHNQFLIRIAGQCLITNYDLIDRASKIMTTCLLFSTQIKRFMETTKVHEVHEVTRHERSQLRFAKNKIKDNDRESKFRANRDERTKRCSDDIYRELCTETYRHMITRFDEVFSAHLAEFTRNLNSEFGQKNNAHLSNLSLQLDYNGFVSSSTYPKA